MADGLVLNPNLAQIPDYAAPAFDAVHNALVQGGRTPEEAIQLLQNAWTAENEHLRQRWEEQQQLERQPNEPPLHPEPQHAPQHAENRQNPPPQRENPPPPPDPQQAPAQAKQKLNPLAQGQLIPSARKPQPAPFALKKLEKLEYVALWYFTEEGCEEALRFDQSTAQDTLALTRVDDTVSRCPINVARTSKYSLPDEKLTWRQMDIAKTLMLHHLEDAKA